MSYKWKPSKTAAREFSAKMDEITTFCDDHCIIYSSTKDSYYFELDGIEYRVSNHTVAASNRHAYNDAGIQVRELYHPDGEKPDVVYITAGKTRIIDIYNDLAAGYKLDRRGNRVTE